MAVALQREWLTVDSQGLSYVNVCYSCSSPKLRGSEAKWRKLHPDKGQPASGFTVPVRKIYKQASSKGPFAVSLPHPLPWWNC